MINGSLTFDHDGSIHSPPPIISFDQSSLSPPSLHQSSTMDLDSAIVDLTNTLTSDPKSWYNSHLVSVTQISTSGLLLLFKTARSMRTLVRTTGGDDRLRHRILASVFYEASTRTSCSFQAAMMRLGGTYLHVDGGAGGNTSASKKGETLEDTIRCLECYADVTVLRHPTTGSVQRVALGEGTVKPVINAGDGGKQFMSKNEIVRYGICIPMSNSRTIAKSGRTSNSGTVGFVHNLG